MTKIADIPRRVVTGLKDGRSVIAEDQQVTNVSEHVPGLVISDIWATNTMPVALHEDISIPNTLIPDPPANGTYFRYVRIPPDREMGIPEITKESEPHPFMHQTNTLDYIIILSGEIYLILDEEETLLKTGDIVIQKGTNHAWSNRSDQPCIQLAILIDANQQAK